MFGDDSNGYSVDTWEVNTKSEKALNDKDWRLSAMFLDGTMKEIYCETQDKCVEIGKSAIESGMCNSYLVEHIVK